MIDPDEAVFPNNAAALIIARVPVAVDADLTVVGRLLRATDPAQSVGVTGAVWMPDPESFEITPAMAGIPTLQRYSITVQGFIKDADEARGLKAHSVLAYRLRSMLYADAPLKVGFSALQASLNGKTERARRWGVESQRFISNELDKTFLFLSVLEFWMETETS